MSSKDQEEQVFANAPTSTEAELARQSGEALRSIHESFVALPEKPETAHRAAPHHHVFDGLAHETCKVGGPKTLSASWMSGPLPEPCRICRSCRLCFWRHFPSPHRHCHHSWCTDIVEASLGRALRPFAMREWNAEMTSRVMLPGLSYSLGLSEWQTKTNIWRILKKNDVVLYWSILLLLAGRICFASSFCSVSIVTSLQLMIGLWKAAAKASRICCVCIKCNLHCNTIEIIGSNVLNLWNGESCNVWLHSETSIMSICSFNASPPPCFFDAWTHSWTWAPCGKRIQEAGSSDQK